METVRRQKQQSGNHASYKQQPDTGKQPRMAGGPCWRPTPPHLAPPHPTCALALVAVASATSLMMLVRGARASHHHRRRHPRQRSHGVHRGLLYAPAAFPRRFAKGPRRAAASTSNPLLKMRVLRLASKLVIAFIGPQLMQ